MESRVTETKVQPVKCKCRGGSEQMEGLRVRERASRGLGSVGFTYVQCCPKERGEGAHYFYVHSQAAQHPPQSARWPKPCANPRSCAPMCPRKHTHFFAQQTLMSPTADIYFPRRRTFTGTRLYFVHRDMRINRAYPHTYTENLVLDALAPHAHEYT